MQPLTRLLARQQAGGKMDNPSMVQTTQVVRLRQVQLAVATGAVLWNAGLGVVQWWVFGTHFGPTLAALIVPVVIALGGVLGVLARSRVVQGVAIVLMGLYCVAAMFSTGVAYAGAVALMFSALVIGVVRNP